MARQTGKPSSSALAERDDDHGLMPSMPAPAGANIVRTQAEVFTAIKVQVPRVRTSLVKACLEEAALMGADWNYSWEVRDKNAPGGKGRVEGESIDAAMVLLRNWGNCTVNMAIEEEGPMHWVFRATFIDYETGFAVPRLFRQRKQGPAGKYDAERALDIAFQIGQSKAQRNAVLKGIPQWLRTQCADAAKIASEKRYENVAESAKTLIGLFGRIKVTREELVRKVGKPVEQWVARDLVLLHQIGKAIKDGITTADVEFRNEEPEQAAEPTPEVQTSAPVEKPAAKPAEPEGFDGPSTAAAELQKLAEPDPDNDGRD